jgi:hypothetical protein
VTKIFCFDSAAYKKTLALSVGYPLVLALDFAETLRGSAWISSECTGLRQPASPKIW